MMTIMTIILIEQTTNVNDLLLFSKAFKVGLIKLNISKLTRYWFNN